MGRVQVMASLMQFAREHPREFAEFEKMAEWALQSEARMKTLLAMAKRMQGQVETEEAKEERQ